MGQFIEGVDRHQAMLLPECLEDYVGEDSPVRAVDAFIDMLDLAGLGFQCSSAATGRPGYHPGLMLRIYLYGYLNQIQCSHHLIVTHEVAILGFDRDALSMMAVAARDEMATDRLTAIVDKGYYKGEEIVASEEAGISVVVPKPMISNAAARGQFDKADFAYDSEKDVYVCPAGENLTYRFTGQQDGKAIRTYWSGACTDCVIKDKCTSIKEGAFVGGYTRVSLSGSKTDWTQTQPNWLSAA